MLYNQAFDAMSTRVMRILISVLSFKETKSDAIQICHPRAYKLVPVLEFVPSACHDVSYTIIIFTDIF